MLGHRDVLIASRNIYGGVHQLLHDWFAKPANLDIAVEHFDGDTAAEFLACWKQVERRQAERFRDGRRACLYLEPPCNPLAMCWSCRGCAGLRTNSGWAGTMFWNIYYVKGALLSADAAFEVMQGMRTLDLRMLHKCINTAILAKHLAVHPDVRVNCNAVKGHPNEVLRARQMALRLPAPLFTFEIASLDKKTFRRFFDNLEPVFSHQISLGQTNTTISCPGLTTHSELDAEAQQRCGIYPNTIRVSLGSENPGDLVRHFAAVVHSVIDPVKPEFSDALMSRGASEKMIRETYLTYQFRFIQNLTD